MIVFCSECGAWVLITCNDGFIKPSYFSTSKALSQDACGNCAQGSLKELKLRPEMIKKELKMMGIA